MTTPQNTTTGSWGASVADWHALQALGLGPDLLPVVADTSLKISPQSRMKGKGKTPSKLNAQGDVVGFVAWPKHRATEQELKRWANDSRLGICVQTRQVKAIDIDIADPVHAQAAQDMVEMVLGALPVRCRSNSGKRLLLVRLPMDFPKRVIKTAHGIIELLSTGQQFVAVGAHYGNDGQPSGARYHWPAGLPTAVPEVSMAELDVCWQGLVDTLALPDGASAARNGMVPTVPRRANDLRDSTVAWLDENGWVTGYERDGRVDVRCPWEDGHSVDSGPSSTSYFPAGVGGFAQGHFRCLHASCSARTDGDFLEAIGLVQSEFDVVEAVANAAGAVDLPLPPFERNRAGRPMATLVNTVMALRRPDVCGARVGYDQFLGSMMVAHTGQAWRPFDDDDYTQLRLLLAQKKHEPISADMMRDAVRLVAMENRFDSAIDWGQALEWDGVERCETFFEDYFGVAPSPYAKAVGRYTWTALAGRLLVPGIKADMAPVLVGMQGAGKTSAIEALSPLPEAFAELDLSRKDDDLARQLRGKLVGELAELRGLQSRDAEAIKAWVSRRVEEWTPKYREFGTRYQRRLILFGTGNREGFLDDETGERRWLPMTSGKVDVARVMADRDQLWAEGIWRFRMHGVEWQDAMRLAQAEHAHYKASDPWLEPIREWLNRHDMDGPRNAGYVRLIDVLMSGLNFHVQKITRKEELRVAKVMRFLGWEKGNRRLDGQLVKVWERVENCMEVDRAENSAFSDLA